jgi:hypothetical protein
MAHLFASDLLSSDQIFAGIGSILDRTVTGTWGLLEHIQLKVSKDSNLGVVLSNRRDYVPTKYY